jgi:hypothetical protein
MQMAEITEVQDELVTFSMFTATLLSKQRCFLHHANFLTMQMAEITEVQDELVTFSMFTPSSAPMTAPSLDGGCSEKIQTHFPLQLYCRAKPWLQVKMQGGNVVVFCLRHEMGDGLLKGR